MASLLCHVHGESKEIPFSGEGIGKRAKWSQQGTMAHLNLPTHNRKYAPPLNKHRGLQLVQLLSSLEKGSIVFRKFVVLIEQCQGRLQPSAMQPHYQQRRRSASFFMHLVVVEKPSC